MLFYLLFSNTVHFALIVVAAVVFFAAGLLYLDSYKVDSRTKKTLLMRAVGFWLLSLVYGFYATNTVSFEVLVLISRIIKGLGLFLILLSLLKEPILHPPKKTASALIVVFPFVTSAISYSLNPLLAVLLLLIGLVYWRKANEGMEKQLKPAAVAFLFLALAEGVKIAFAWNGTLNVFWSKMLAQYGTVWHIADGLTLIGVAVLGIWVWGYVRFRLQIQIFVITFALSIFTFLIITVFFTYLLLNNMKQDALSHLKTDVNVIQYALDSLKSETLAHAQAVAQDSRVQQAILLNDKKTLYDLAENFLGDQKTSSLVIATASGEVLVRAENQGLTNDNVGSLPIVQAAFKGERVSTVNISDGITAPEVIIDVAVPVLSGSSSEERPNGVVVTGIKIDNAFVDGIKSVTGLEASIFGGDKRSATTFVAQDGKSRFTGSLETNKKVTETVLDNGQIYVGDSSIFNQSYFVAYAPLKNYQGEVVGMLFTGKPQNTLSEAAQRSVNLTFLGSTLLMVFSMIPAYFVAEYIKRNVSA